MLLRFKAQKYQRTASAAVACNSAAADVNAHDTTFNYESDLKDSNGKAPVSSRQSDTSCIRKQDVGKPVRKNAAACEGYQPQEVIEDVIAGIAVQHPADGAECSAIEGLETGAAQAASVSHSGQHPVPPALLLVMRKLAAFGRNKNLYLQGAFGPGMPIWRLADNITIMNRLSKRDRAWLLGSGDHLSRCRQLVRQLQPLVGRYLELNKQLVRSGCPTHKVAVWCMKLQHPSALPRVPEYHAPKAWDCFDDEAVMQLASTSYKEHPTQVVYTYNLLPAGHELLRQTAKAVSAKAVGENKVPVKRGDGSYSGSAAATDDAGDDADNDDGRDDDDGDSDGDNDGDDVGDEDYAVDEDDDDGTDDDY